MPGGRKFIRHVSIDSSPSCVLTTDAQLANIQRFCNVPGEACVLGIDPTFNLGKFYVTVTTYTYLHVENRISHLSPTFFRPMFVHTEKTYEAYYHFFFTLLKLEPRIRDIIAVGTDGEQAIVKSLEALFPDSLIHLRCFVHMRDNIRRKLSDMLLPQSMQNTILHDIFGSQQGTVYTNGLIDAMSNSEFEQNLDTLKSKWNELELSIHPNSPPEFHKWLLRNEAHIMKESMISSVRQAAGLGCPPAIYTTNRNESMNKVAKTQADHQRSTWVQLTNNMFDLVNDQLQEIEKAVHGMGEYRFKSQYKHLELDSSKRFMMSPQQRQKHLKKVFQQSCIPYQCNQQTASTRKSTSEAVSKNASSNPPSSEQSISWPSTKQHLSIPVQQSGITNISADMLTCMWEKAERLLNAQGNICSAPGMPDSFCVASEGLVKGEGSLMSLPEVRKEL